MRTILAMTWCLVLCLGVSGCGGLKPQEVEYSMSCNKVSCDEADDIATVSYDGIDSIVCTWTCATYEGDPESYVMLGFVVVPGGCYELVTEYVSSCY